MRSPWSRIGVRARSTLIGMALALLVLGLTVGWIFARHPRGPERSEIRIQTRR